jgi:beta-fructofuranosidase
LPANSTEGVFTGSAVIDVKNASGFFSNQSNGVLQSIPCTLRISRRKNLAFSLEGGYTFNKDDRNPILEAGSLNFRVPNAKWHAPTQKWAMVVAYTQEYTIGIFTSGNSINWIHASNFLHHGPLGSQYEYSNMVEVPMKNAAEPIYLMCFSINPGAPLEAAFSQYFPGIFNGSHFTALGGARIADFGNDN